MKINQRQNKAWIYVYKLWYYICTNFVPKARKHRFVSYNHRTDKITLHCVKDYQLTFEITGSNWEETEIYGTDHYYLQSQLQLYDVIEIVGNFSGSYHFASGISLVNYSDQCVFGVEFRWVTKICFCCLKQILVVVKLRVVTGLGQEILYTCCKTWGFSDLWHGIVTCHGDSWDYHRWGTWNIKVKVWIYLY